jgi:N utilization substance protein B
LLRFLKHKESFTDILEDAFPNWVDDKSLILGALKKTFKALPLKEGWLRDFYPDAQTVQQFGENLFIKTVSNREELKQIITPKLKNWKIDRLALIDKLCLEMAIVEFMHFPTIPVKVTINEYVDLSKRYSTDNSKEFINGLLDKVKVDLLANGKIIKQGRGLQQ